MLNSPHKLPLLQAPILRVNQTLKDPWFELLPEQCPGATLTHVRRCLDFLKAETVDSIVAGFPNDLV